MPTITSTMPRQPGPEWPCAWCKAPTDVLADTPGRPDIGRLPLHIGCGVAILRAFERLRAGMVLDASTQQRIAQYQAKLLAASGHV